MQKQKILIIGAGGGREHAIGWKVAQSARAGELFFVRGNAGTAELGTNLDMKETDTGTLLDFAKKEKIDLTLVLSDDPLALGTVDAFRKENLRVWGPTKAASQLEWSKAFSKDFMKRHNLPTAKFEIFDNFEKAKKYIKREAVPIVIKADGLALGKGVIIAQTKEEAYETLENIFVKKIFGNSGNTVVIEEFLVGPEISIHAWSDGKSYKMFPASQDHKRIGDGDIGPNTGGIGTICPLPFVDEKLLKRIEREIVAPTLEGMKKDGTPFEGILYPGLILTKDGPKILEYNARFGDPEAQVYVRLMESDLLDIIDSCIDGKLDELQMNPVRSRPLEHTSATVTSGRPASNGIKWKENAYASNVVLSSGGYPGEYKKNKEIKGIGSKDKEIIIFHAGTKMENNKLVTNGGRVLGVSAIGSSLKETLDKAYKAIQKISFGGMQYRRDIGKKALELSKLP